jgi:hypothetical protein
LVCRRIVLSSPSSRFSPRHLMKLGGGSFRFNAGLRCTSWDGLKESNNHHAIADLTNKGHRAAHCPGHCTSVSVTAGRRLCRLLAFHPLLTCCPKSLH